MIDRRAFLSTLVGSLLAAPLAVQAQQAGTVPKIGYLGVSPSIAEELFRQGLRELGRIEGQNITIEYRWTEGKIERLPKLVAELIHLKVNVILTVGSIAAAQAAKQATTSIPIVFQIPGNPVQVGLVASLARPGGNLTGLAGEGTLNPKRLALLKEALPQVTRVAILWNPANPFHEAVLKSLEDTGRSLGVQLHPVRVSRPDELESAFFAITRGHVGALFVLADAMVYTERKRILALSVQSRLPTMYAWRSVVEAGGLMSYSEDWSDMSRRNAAYIDKILKGANPGDLPVEQPTKFELVINLKTAKALGLTIPPSLLQRADQVIE
jgi:putative tryptophan/tyrosine transport system substrate-binding protein